MHNRPAARAPGGEAIRKPVSYTHLEIQISLRSGDVFTQYSSCQYLVMISDASAENVEMIADRICTAFYKAIGGECQGVLLHHCYQMCIRDRVWRCSGAGFRTNPSASPPVF